MRLRFDDFSSLRMALLLAMGLPAGCGGEVTSEPHQSSEGAGASGAGAAGSSTSAANTSATGVSSGTGGEAACKNSQPIVIGGVDTGYAKCADGAIHKPKPAACD